MKTLIATAAIAAVTATAALAGGPTPAPADAKGYFINLTDGATVSSPVNIKFGLSGMGIAPAGIEKENTGHHHLIINEKIEGEELESGIPSDESHVHFGKGQTEATLDLPAGTHTLQLVLGDHGHVPHADPVMSERITITVK